MGLTQTQFARAAALEAGQQRLVELQRMSYHELRKLLTGDPQEAATWVRCAAESGMPAAQLRLGRMLLEGDGIPQDRAAAFDWFDRAAFQDDADAANMVGRCLENGWGVSVDLCKAAASYRRAADAGLDWGEYNLANLLFDGRGVAQDRPQALGWYLRAARQGHGRAMNLVGRCLEEGWGCTACAAQAAHWYRRSAETGYFRGQFNYALVLAQLGEQALAHRWLAQAAQGGDDAMRRAIAAAIGRPL